MNKKGDMFMPILIIGLLIVMSIIMFKGFTAVENTQEFFSIGSLQSNIIKNYFESEKVFFYYEKLLEYNEYKTIKEFSENGAVPKNCNKKWKFNSDCEPNFKEYFKEILNKNIENKEININSDIEVYFTDFKFPTKTNTAEVEYKGKILVKKEPLINFQELQTLKKCIKDKINNKKEITTCKITLVSGNTYKIKAADILNEDLEKEEIFLEFKIDTKNSGLPTLS